MKKFFKFGKDKNKTLTPEPSPTLSKHGSVSSVCGYEIREKDLGKLHKAAWNGDLNKVKQLAKKCASPLDKDNRTPLHLACVRGYESVVQELLEWKAKTNICDNASKTPLLKAVECKQEGCIRQLLEHKADPNVKDIDGESSLHYAVRDEATNILEILLQSDKVFPDIKNKDGQTPLHIAIKKRNLKMAKLLLDHGANVNAVDNTGMTVLMTASQDGATDVVKFLLENGSDINKKNKKGWTADDIALMETQEEVRGVLREYVGGRSGEIDPSMIMSPGEWDKSQDNIPPPTSYGGPASASEDPYSEIDHSKMSEAAGGLDTWNDNTDDDSEIQNKAKVPILNLAKICKQKEEGSPGGVAVSSRSVVSEQSVVCSDWSDDESILSSARDTKMPVVNQQLKTAPRENGQTDGRSTMCDKTDVIRNGRQQESLDQNGSDSWDEDSLLMSSPRHMKTAASSRSQLASVTEEDIKDSVYNDVKQNDVIDKESSATVSKVIKSEQERKNKASIHNELLEELGISDTEDVSDPDFDDESIKSQHTHQKVETSGGEKKQDAGNESDWDSTIASDLSPRGKGALSVLMELSEDEDVPMPHEQSHFQGRDVQKSSSQPSSPAGEGKSVAAGNNQEEDSKWDSEESEIMEPPPLPSEAPPTALPSASGVVMYPDDEDEVLEIESTWEKENQIKKQQEEKVTMEWQHDIQRRRLVQQDEAEDELRKEEKEERRQMAIKLDETQNQNENKENRMTVNPERSDCDQFGNEKSRRLSEQCQAVDRELAEIKVQKQLSRLHQSVDDEDTFHNVPEMESPRKLDTSGGMFLPPDVTVSHVQDEDCLSYSSTEHEASIHDDCRSHHLVPVSFSVTTDSTSVMRLQQQLRDAQQKLEKERSTRLSQENKLKSVNKERDELIRKLEDVSKAKSLLEQQKIDMEANIRNLQYQLKEETEKCKQFEVLYNKTREQLSRKDDQFTQEVESKQLSDLSLRNLEMELKTAQALISQLEEEKQDLQRKLDAEKNARQLQEQISEEQLKFQMTVRPNNLQTDSEMELLGNVLTKGDSNVQTLGAAEKANIELHATKLELERLSGRSKDEHDLMMIENNELHQKINDMKETLQINKEALAQASLKYNMELTALNTEKTKMIAILENEKTTRDKLESEVNSLKHRLGTASAELSKAQEARSELERRSFSQQEDLSRQLERKDQELTRLQEHNQNLFQKLSDAENKANKLENELHIANATLIERTNQRSTVERELDQRRTNQEIQEQELHKVKEENARLQTKLEGVQERLKSLQEEMTRLHQQLDDARVQAVGVGKEEGDRFTKMLSTLRDDHNKSGLENYLHKLEVEKANLESQLKHETQKVEMLQQELDDSHKQQNDTQAPDDDEKRKSQKAKELKRITESKLSVEQQRIAELQKEVSVLKTHLRAAKKRLKEVDNSDPSSEMSYLQIQLEEANKKVLSEACTRQQLEEKTRQLEAELRAVRSMEKSYSKLDRAKRKLEEDLSLYKSHVDNDLSDLPDLDKIKAELEAKARLELNRKLEEVNIYLEEQARARDKLDRMRDINESEMKKEFEHSRNELLEDINRLRQSYTELLNQKDLGTDDAQRFKRLYEVELQTREQLAKRLERALKMQERAQTVIDRQNTSGSIFGPVLENGWSVGVNRRPENLRSDNELSAKILQELDKSIAKNLEKGPHIDIRPPLRSSQDNMLSPSGHRSSSEYLSVLKKNYLL